ncbi:hypothetical protein F9L07_01005 [Pimelobacter simplex]|uniref:phospholipase D n=1 Tax=Nocardioides simplex TaxID=2045 RepID=A0A7J5DX60_NOCSI|nr:hypothetical protein F9L07_01005 [Pimelobacter simplex]
MLSDLSRCIYIASVLGTLGRRLLTAIVAGGLLVASGAAPAPARDEGSPAAARAAWLPATGPVFNDPTGRPAQRRQVVKRVHQAIRHTPAGATIRVATYNVDRNDTADLLLQARARGVAVQIVVNDNLVNPVIKRLQRRLGRNPARSSFLVICKAACRNGSRTGNLHMKVYAFSQSGAARSVMINSSSNLGRAAANGQWNDAITVYGDDALFASWVAVFDQLKRDRPAAPRYVTYQSDTLRADFQRPFGTGPRGRVVVARSGDPQLRRLRQVGCRPPAGYGVGGRSVVRVNMYAWYGARGERLARELASMRREGCQVSVIGAVVSAPVVSILRGAGIPVRAADWDWGEKPATSGDEIVFGSRCYSHLKYVTVDGLFRGRGTRVVWTGSENWSAPGLSSDEVTFEIHDAAAVRAYDAQWWRMWRSPRATHRTGSKPTSRPCA